MEINKDNIPFFSSLTEEQQKNLFPLIEEEILNENQTLFQKGDFGNKMYFIKSGKIKIFDTKKNLTSKIAQALSLQKKEKEISILETGEFFGEMALISEKPRIFSAKSIENTILYSINKNGLRELLTSNLESERIIAETFVQRVIKNN